MISFHNTCARYGFALGRERVLVGALGQTSPRSGAPVVASLIQSAIGLAVIVIYAICGVGPGPATSSSPSVSPVGSGYWC